MEHKREKKEKKKSVYRAQSTNESTTETTEGKVLIKDVPPRCSTEDLALTLRVIKDHGGDMQGIALGNILRNEYGRRTVSQQDAQKERQANSKLGEERGKAVAYLSLATILHCSDGNHFKITGLGEKYLKETTETQNSIIYDQIRNKEIFKLLRSRFSDSEIDEFNNYHSNNYRNLKEFLYKNVEGTEQTINRKVPICKDWLILIKNEEQS